MQHISIPNVLLACSVGVIGLPLSCLTPPPQSPATPSDAAAASERQSEGQPDEAPLDAWAAAAVMSPGINIGNTLENTTQWETGWGNPRITREFVESLAGLGFKTVRLPVAWDTYAVEGQIQPDKLDRVAEVVDWIIGAGMFSVVNIHWDGGWIDSSNKEKFADTYATFSADAERKYRSYWQQIASHFADRSGRLIFEALNEETNFSNQGSEKEAYRTLTRVNQLFIDTVRGTGGNNSDRLLIVAGYHTDIAKTCHDLYELPKDTVAHKLFVSVHYYTPWQFCGLTEDADWGKVMPTWGAPKDVAQLVELFDQMEKFASAHDIPVFLGEYNATEKRESASRVRWLTAVTQAAVARRMVPVLWDTGGEVSRRAPYGASPVLPEVLKSLH